MSSPFYEIIALFWSWQHIANMDIMLISCRKGAIILVFDQQYATQRNTVNSADDYKYTRKINND